MPARPHDREFVIWWLDAPPAVRDKDGYITAPHVKVVGRSYVKRHDMSDALTAARRMQKTAPGYGFVVASVR